MPTTSETIVQELLATAKTGEEFIGPQQIGMWSEILRQCPRQEAFEALFGVFAVRDGTAQQAAGELLLAVRPACTLSIAEAVARILPTWNISVEELVEYFEALAGREVLLRALNEVRSQPLSESAQVALDTIHYWLCAFDQGYTSRGFL